MNDQQLFDQALILVNGRLVDLAARCDVHRVTVWSWRRRAAVDKLPPYARIRLANVIRWAAKGDSIAII